jgi:trafficking protein particle complex subunit 6
MSFESVMPPYNSQDAAASSLNISCLDFLLIELVPLAYRVTNELEPAMPPPAHLGAQPGDGSLQSGGAAIPGGGGSVRKMDEDEERDAVFNRLEELGYRVGQGLVERFVFTPRRSLNFLAHRLTMSDFSTSRHSFSRDRPRFTEPLDMIKFICKDLWSLFFRKQVDNLKTNHRVS